MHLLAAATSLLLAAPSALAAGLYNKGSPVLQVGSKDFDSHIKNTNHTSIVEFYAPWCGHCQSLKPAFEKAAKSLSGLAKVAAVNCDEESNKPLCGQMGIQGFPTLKIVRPGKKTGKPSIEDYKGARSAKAIVEAVIDKIPNHVTRLKDAELESWSSENVGPKAILFSDKGVVSALLKALAIDFLGSVDVAQVRNKETEAVKKYGISRFPTLVLLPGEGKDPIKYHGDMKKEPIVAFLSQAASPNPDPAPKKAKSSSKDKKDKSKSSKASSSFSKASATHASAEGSESPASQTAETLEEESNPTESPDPKVDSEHKPVHVPVEAAPIASLPDGLSLQQKCLNDKASTCILALLPSNKEASADSTQAVASLSEIHHKHEAAKRNLFPFYQLPSYNSQATAIRKLLSLSEGIELIAINGKRGWYRHLDASSGFTTTSIESWIDAIRMDDIAKSKLPDNIIVPRDALPSEPVKFEAATDDPEKMREQLKNSMPEGVDFEFEEIDDDEYDRIMKAGEKAKEEREQAEAESEHDEL